MVSLEIETGGFKFFYILYNNRWEASFSVTVYLLLGHHIILISFPLGRLKFSNITPFVTLIFKPIKFLMKT